MKRPTTKINATGNYNVEIGKLISTLDGIFAAAAERYRTYSTTRFGRTRLAVAEKWFIFLYFSRFELLGFPDFARYECRRKLTTKKANNSKLIESSYNRTPSENQIWEWIKTKNSTATSLTRYRLPLGGKREQQTLTRFFMTDYEASFTRKIDKRLALARKHYTQQR